MENINVCALEIVEDFTSTARCDEGFLHIKRLKVQNRREDGSTSPIYRVDYVQRPEMDAVAVLVWRRTAQGMEFLTRHTLRPAIYWGASQDKGHLFCEEVVAGLLEAEDAGDYKRRAAQEVLEEAGFSVTAGHIEGLGTPLFVSPGILSERIFLTAVDVTGLPCSPPEGDGSPLEEGGTLTWRSLETMRDALNNGTLQDAKTELVFLRFLRHNRHLTDCNEALL